MGAAGCRTSPSATRYVPRDGDLRMRCYSRPADHGHMTLDVDMLEASFDLIAPRGRELVDRFYVRLFETAPTTRRIFAHVNMKTQKDSLLATLIAVRQSVRNIGSMASDLEQLGARHVGYGATPEHYPIVASVLVDTMAEIGGAQWQPAYSAAWSEALHMLAEVMLRGAARVARPAVMSSVG
jgi:hemoglobin-like flavoprotein